MHPLSLFLFMGCSDLSKSTMSIGPNISSFFNFVECFDIEFLMLMLLIHIHIFLLCFDIQLLFWDAFLYCNIVLCMFSSERFPSRMEMNVFFSGWWERSIVICSVSYSSFTSVSPLFLLTFWLMCFITFDSTSIETTEGVICIRFSTIKFSFTYFIQIWNKILKSPL